MRWYPLPIASLEHCLPNLHLINDNTSNERGSTNDFFQCYKLRRPRTCACGCAYSQYLPEHELPCRWNGYLLILLKWPWEFHDVQPFLAGFLNPYLLHPFYESKSVANNHARQVLVHTFQWSQKDDFHLLDGRRRF